MDSLDNDLQFEDSIGYQARLTNRFLQRYLQQKIEPHGVTTGTWYFLRALWREDGLTQRELSHIVGTREPTTLSAIKSMEAGGLVERKRNTEDRRKINIFLTQHGKALKGTLMPLGKEVVDDAMVGFTDEQRKNLFEMLSSIQSNLANVNDGN